MKTIYRYIIFTMVFVFFNQCLGLTGKKRDSEKEKKLALLGLSQYTSQDPTASANGSGGSKFYPV